MLLGHAEELRSLHSEPQPDVQRSGGQSRPSLGANARGVGRFPAARPIPTETPTGARQEVERFLTSTVACDGVAADVRRKASALSWQDPLGAGFARAGRWSLGPLPIGVRGLPRIKVE